MKFHYRHIIIALFSAFLMAVCSSCVSRVMYQDGEFDGSEIGEGDDEIHMLNSELDQDDLYHE